jgi:CO dehydrogenase nickel-insertion accessory protein CooC1
MIVSVASGKGGTGKTTVTASLAMVWDGPLVAVVSPLSDEEFHEVSEGLAFSPTYRSCPAKAMRQSCCAS